MCNAYFCVVKAFDLQYLLNMFTAKQTYQYLITVIIENIYVKLYKRQIYVTYCHFKWFSLVLQIDNVILIVSVFIIEEAVNMECMLFFQC